MYEIIPVVMIVAVIACTMVAKVIMTKSIDMKPHIDKNASPEFEQKTADMFKRVKNRHPDLRNANVDLIVTESIDFHKHAMQNIAYGCHIADISRSETHHTIIIAEKPHLQREEKLYDTITHEFAHLLDVERRGTSGHGPEFEACKMEIETRSNEVRITA